MKVLHLIGGGDVGGAKIHVLSLVKELSKHIEVKLISLRQGEFSEEARAMGIDIEIVRTGNTLKDIKEILKTIKSGNFEIIHSHGAKANMMSAIIKKKTGIPTVTTVHSDYRLDYLQSVPKMLSFGLINTLALRFIDYYIGVSNNFKEMLVQRKFNPDSIFTVYNGINFDAPMEEYSRQSFAKKYNITLADSDIVVGVLARLDPVKGIHIFLQAAKEVLDKNPRVKFIVGGDGKERKNLEYKAQALGISDSILFPGWINDRYEFMSVIDINVLTSLSESFPYVILEGTSFKKATVSSRVGGVSDLIDSGYNGYLFKVGDHKELAGHILKLVNNSSLRKVMGERIYEKARAEFSLDHMRETQLGIYEKILEDRQKSQSDSFKNGRRVYDTVISGWYGVRNIGDDAILRAIIGDLRTLKDDISILVLSKNPGETRSIYNVDSIYRYNILEILKAMRNTRLFISGGGTLIQDGTSTRSLIYYLSTIWLAKKLGLKVMIYANGIGPVSKKINRWLTRTIVNQVDIITLREEQSKNELSALGIDSPKVYITADPALTISPADDKVVDSVLVDEGIGLVGPFVGFSIREWQGHKKYEEIIAKIADYVIDKYKAKPVFIPMQYPGDVRVMESITSKMNGRAYIIKGKYGDTGEGYALGIIKRMEILIGMRLHSLIFAASTGVPVIGLVYEQKVDDFLKYINQGSYASARNVKDLDYKNLEKMVDDIWIKRTAIKSQLREITELHRERAVQNARIAIDLINADREQVIKEHGKRGIL